jgi:hypothetical protein
MLLEYYFIPIVPPECLDGFNILKNRFVDAIFQYYRIFDKPVFRLPSDVKWLLSSVMPDYLLATQNIHIQFASWAKDKGINKVIVWDLPTYLDKIEEAEENIPRCLEYIDWFENKGFDVIPLIKGATPDQIRWFCNEVAERGYEDVAFHASEFLSSRLRPYPYYPDKYISAKDYLLLLLKEVVNYPFKRILVLGGASPRHMDLLMDLSDKIVLAGLSWYIDARRFRVYTDKRKIKYLGKSYFECDCPICKYVSAKQRRTPYYIALHNLYYNWLYIEGDDKHRFETYDLIVDANEILIVTSNLYIGHPQSLWQVFFNKMKRVKPTYIILIGNTLYLDNPSDKNRQKWSELIRILSELYEEHGTISIFMKGRSETYPIDILTNDSFLYREAKDPLINKFTEEPGLLTLIKFYSGAKQELTVKKKTLKEEFTIKIANEKIIDHLPPEEAIKLVRNDKSHKGYDWIFTNLLNYPYVDYKEKVAIPGEWTLFSPSLTEPRPGYIVVDKNGSVKVKEIRYHEYT